MGQETLALRAPELGAWQQVPEVVRSVSGMHTAALGIKPMGELVRALVARGWRLKELDLRDKYRERLSVDESEYWRTQFEQWLANPTLPSLGDLASCDIASARLSKGVQSITVRRAGVIEVSGTDRTEKLAQELDGVVQEVWAA